MRGFYRRFTGKQNGESGTSRSGVSAAGVHRRRAGLAKAQKQPWRYMQFLDDDSEFSKYYPATKYFNAGSRSKTSTIIRENLLDRLVK